MLHRAGCRHLAVVSSTAGTPSIVTREQSFVAAAAELGLEAQVSRAGPTSYATGAEGARQLLGASSRPDGVFCVTDLLALGFMDVARLEFRLDIPEALCVVGFDDIPQAGWIGYNLPPSAQAGGAIADHIVAIIEGRAEPAPPKRLPTQVAWRKSVRPRTCGFILNLTGSGFLYCSFVSSENRSHFSLTNSKVP